MQGPYRLNIVRCLLCMCAVALAAAVVGCSPVRSQEPHRVGLSEKLDAASAVNDADRSLLWYDARMLTIEGKGFNDTEQFFHRLPARAKSKVRKLVWKRSTCSAGMAVRFATDARDIWVRWKLGKKDVKLVQQPDTGVNGVDLYVYLDGRYRWIGVGRPAGELTNESRLVAGMTDRLHEYMLYLPLFNEVVSAEVGVPVGATIGKPLLRLAARSKPICFYGTSIIHGACASRAGMTMVAMVGRRLDWPMINLGFGGAGKMEMEIADLLAELDVAVYVLDCLPNMTEKMVRERLEPFVLRLREAKPDTPIVLVESVTFPSRELIEGPRAKYARKNAMLKEIYKRLQAQNVDQLYYVPGDHLLGTDGEGTVEGIHPTDLGFYRFANAIEPVLRSILDQ